MESNQKILYKHYKKVSVEGKTDIIRDKAKRNAENILKSFPQFEVKIETNKQKAARLKAEADSKEK